MSTPSPFEVARGIGNNFNRSFKRAEDENAIEQILSEAIQSGDQRVLQNSIGQILSQVSPERQGAAVQYLQGLYNNIERKTKEGTERALGQSAAKEAGYTYGAPAQVAAEQVKSKAKSARLAPYNLAPQQPGQQGQPGQMEQTEAFAPEMIAPQMQAQDETVFNRMTDNQLIQAAGHPDREVSEPAKQEIRARQEARKEDRADTRERRKETLPLKENIIARADASRESIRNKTHLIELIDKGNINDPTFAIFAESLPFNLGKRLLSEDTVEYKGGLVDEFADLKNIFKGATRVKEVEIYENKLADIYLNDAQKKAILKSRINTAKVDLIREEAAAEVENMFPNIGALQFNKKVDDIAKPKINALFNTIWDEQKAIIDQAERRKDMPLDINDPDDVIIIDQILKEANGNYLEAEKIAKKKGYKF